MSKSEKRRYTREFGAEAIKLVLEQRMTLEAAGAIQRDIGELGERGQAR